MKFAQEQYILGEKYPDCLPWVSQKTKLTKLTEETIFLERYWDKEGNKIKFDGIYEEMPDELVNEPIGTIFVDETGEYKTGRQEYRRTGKTIKGLTPAGRHHIRQGISKWYYENGNICKIVEYKDGSIRGKYECYWPNGKIALKGIKYGRRVGLWEDWDEEGNKIGEKTYPDLLKNDQPLKTPTKITKISEEKIFIERFWNNGNLKFSGYYIEMPKELINEPIGTKINFDGYETGMDALHVVQRGMGYRDGMAIWYNKNGNINKKIMHKENTAVLYLFEVDRGNTKWIE